jgi:hypothetical protein
MQNYRVIDNLLNGVGVKLQLDKTRRDRVEQSYKAVSEWLDKDDSIANGAPFSIYPQGSYRLGTTVRPILGNEYDLDFVIEVQMPWNSSIDAMAFLKQIYNRLRENDVYKDKVELKNRCVRINYKDDFHMDILPSYPVGYVGNINVKVPDRKTEYWKDSAPKGYADWFEDCCKYLSILLEKAAKVEELPEETPFEMKPPLKRAVQLIKRFRDIYFEDVPDKAPISIVLTTLAGLHYNKSESVFLTIKYILNAIANEINKADKMIEVYNPVNPAEKLSERWDTDKSLYKSFKDFVMVFNQEWLELENTLEKGLPAIKAKLQELFGETVATEVLTEYANFINRNRQSSTLGVSSTGGLLTGLSSKGKETVSAVARNNFYGGEK